MSDTAIQPEASLPTPDEAFYKLASDVQGQAFWSTLADCGIYPQNEAEAESLLKLANDLRAEQAEKVASSNRFAFVNGQQPAQQGVQYDPSVVQANVKQAAAQLLHDPAIYASVVSLKLAQSAA